MVIAAQRTATAILVFELDCYHRATVAPHQPFKLRGDLLEVCVYIADVDGVVRTSLRGFFQQPVGKATVADLGVRPRSDAGDDVHAVLRAELDELAQILIAGPVPLV